tara:strand:- start:172586 stop:172963 length:378 start_codon:yes stop_codon:yes gene_type:complete
MRNTLALFAGCLLVAGYVCLPAVAADDDKPKYSIEDVMKKGMGKKGLLAKVTSGEASEAETKTLHEMFVALAAHEPPKGEADSWKKKTRALVKAAKAAVDGEDDAAGKLKKAANCKACHSEHKPS